MIDLHAHILPSVDDGARNWEETMAMCRMAAEDGIRVIATTSHYQDGGMRVPRHTVLDLGKKLEKRLQAEDVDLRVIAGNEIMAHPAMVDNLKKRDVLTYNDAYRYTLFELPVQGLPLDNIKDLIFAISLEGIIPILAHPERNMMLRRKPDLLEDIVGMGVFTQITAQSLLGENGEEAETLALRWFRQNLGHFLASDAHNLHKRKPLLRKAFERLQNEVSEDQYRKIRDEYPLAVIEGRTLDLPVFETKKKKASSGFSFFDFFKKQS